MKQFPSINRLSAVQQKYDAIAQNALLIIVQQQQSRDITPFVVRRRRHSHTLIQQIKYYKSRSYQKLDPNM